MRRLQLALLAAFLAACTSTNPSALPTVSQSASPTAEPSPKPPLTNKQLGRLYLRAVTPFNKKTCRIQDRIDQLDRVNWEAYRAPFGHAADFIRTLADKLRRIDWNHDVRREASRLIDATGALEAALRNVEGADDVQGLNLAINRAYLLAQRRQEASNILRGALGLPSLQANSCD